MAILVRKVKIDSAGNPYVKIDGLQLFPTSKEKLYDGQEIIFIGKNGKYKAKDGVQWIPLGIKIIESNFKPLDLPIVKADQTLDRVKLAVLQLEYGNSNPVEFNVGKEYIEVKFVENGKFVSKKYNGMEFSFYYRIDGNTVSYTVVKKPQSWTWSYDI